MKAAHIVGLLLLTLIVEGRGGWNLLKASVIVYLIHCSGEERSGGGGGGVSSCYRYIIVIFMLRRTSEPRMALGRGHHSLRHHWYRPEADTGDVHCRMRRRWRDVWWSRESAANSGRLGGFIKDVFLIMFCQF